MHDWHGAQCAHSDRYRIVQDADWLSCELYLPSNATEGHIQAMSNHSSQLAQAPGSTALHLSDDWLEGVKEMD